VTWPVVTEPLVYDGTIAANGNTLRWLGVNRAAIGPVSLFYQIDGRMTHLVPPRHEGRDYAVSL